MTHNNNKEEHRCPCCGQQMPANDVERNKRNINEKLAKLTNPPMPVHEFYDQARAILKDYGIPHASLLEIGVGYSSPDPGFARNPFPEWNCVLVLGWCYKKVEVAYFS